LHSNAGSFAFVNFLTFSNLKPFLQLDQNITFKNGGFSKQKTITFSTPLAMQSLPEPVRKDSAKARKGYRCSLYCENQNANTVKWNKRDMVCRNSEGVIVRRLKKGDSATSSSRWYSPQSMEQEELASVQNAFGSLLHNVPYSLGRYRRWELVTPLHKVAEASSWFLQVQEVPLMSTTKQPLSKEYLPKPKQRPQNRRFLRKSACLLLHTFQFQI